jgi:hypothetical protein
MTVQREARHCIRTLAADAWHSNRRAVTMSELADMAAIALRSYAASTAGMPNEDEIESREGLLASTMVDIAVSAFTGEMPDRSGTASRYMMRAGASVIAIIARITFESYAAFAPEQLAEEPPSYGKHETRWAAEAEAVSQVFQKDKHLGNNEPTRSRRRA